MAVLLSFLGILGLFTGCGDPQDPGAPAPAAQSANGGEEEQFSDELTALKAVDMRLGLLVECVWSDSGDENGNTDRLSLSRGEDGGIYLTAEYSPAVWEPLQIRVYRADDDALDQARALIDRYNLAAWKDLPEGDEFALDASVTHISMYFDNSGYGGESYDSFSFDEFAALPPEGMKIMNEFRDCLKQWATDDRLAEERTEER